jgi:putative hemolysin
MTIHGLQTKMKSFQALAQRAVLPAQEGSVTPSAETRVNPFEVRLARPEELDEVFSLRYDVFLAAHALGSGEMRDEDIYDQHADHLIVKAENRIVGTYRLLPVDRILNAGLIPYSANEFDLAALIESFDPRTAVELGRSCVHPAYRNGSIPKLLWNAIASYMNESGRSEAFGSVSVFNVNHDEAVGLSQYLREQGAWAESFPCPALVPAEGDAGVYSKDHIKGLLPPLLRSYLMLGAKLHGGPSHDPVFHSHDFVIHFSTRTMSERCRRMFFNF